MYAWADGIYVRAGLEKEKATLLVVIGAMSDGRKEVLALVPGYRESTAAWSEVLCELRDRGLHVPKLLVADGNLGIWGAAREVWPEVAEQRCWNHKITNVLAKLPKMIRREAFALRYEKGYPEAVACLGADWDRLVTFYEFPEAHWRHLRTTNVVESPFAALRLRTDAA